MITHIQSFSTSTKISLKYHKPRINIALRHTDRRFNELDLRLPTGSYGSSRGTCCSRLPIFNYDDWSLLCLISASLPPLQAEESLSLQVHIAVEVVKPLMAPLKLKDGCDGLLSLASF